MKKGMKLLTAVTAITAATGVLFYRKHRRNINLIAELTEGNDDSDFEPITYVDDGFDYIVDDPEQLLFYE